MIRNYLKIALRSLSKNKIYSLINVAGLSVGLACVLVIVSYIRLELSYDDFNLDYQRTYRVTEHRSDEGRHIHSATSFNPLGDLIESHVHAVDKVIRMYPIPLLVSVDREIKIKVPKFTFVDSLFFEVFTFEVLHGNLKKSLEAPFSVVLTESQAHSYFGTSDVVGKDLYVENEIQEYTFMVTAVVKDIPQNAHFNPDLISSLSSVETIQPWYNNWHHPPLYTYVQLKEGYKKSDLESQIKEMGEIHFPEYIKKENRAYETQNITDIHLRSDLEFEWQPNSSETYIRLFLIIAFFVLLIACINFMNLATAQSTNRAMEVGIRKVMGASKKQLIYQFLGESVLTTLVSFLIALGLAELVLNYFFNNLVGKEISLGYLFSRLNMMILAATILAVSLMAGAYPSFYLSAFKPIVTLRSKILKVKGLGNLRKVMISMQFFISCLLIIGTLLVLKQVNYLRFKQLGFDKEQIVAVKLVDRKDQINYHILKESFLKESSVVHVALSSTIPGSEDFYGWNVIPEGYPSDTEHTMRSLGVDEDYLSTYSIQLILGRDFSKDISTDGTQAFIINKAAADNFGWQNPINKDFTMEVYTGKHEIRKGKVIGVVDNFHFQSLYNRIEPLVIYINKHPHYSDYLNVKLSPGNIDSSLKLLEARWNDFNPDKPFEYYFIDQELEKFYEREVKISQIFSSFAVISIIISCMGLFGLSAFTASQRTKEIGIRKVFGATLPGIVKMLSKEYAVLIIISNLVAWPMAWYYGTRWLSEFPYRISISADIFIITLLGALLIAIVTVSFQSVKAATANPIKSLKSE